MDKVSYNKTIMREPYPRNLLLAVEYEVKDRNVDFSVGEITDDILEGIEYSLNMLAERELQILMLRYKEGKTFVEIGSIFGISDSRVASVARKSVYKLCRPPMLGYLKYGKKAYDDRIKQYEAEKMAKGFSEESLNTPIAELNLSIRNENILRNAGCVTLRDVVNLSEEELIGMKNLGRAAGQEIAYKLRAIGTLHTKWDRFFDAKFITNYDVAKRKPQISREKAKKLIELTLLNMIDDPNSKLTAEQVQNIFAVLTSEEGLNIIMELLNAVAKGKLKPEPQK